MPYYLVAALFAVLATLGWSGGANAAKLGWERSITCMTVDATDPLSKPLETGSGLQMRWGCKQKSLIQQIDVLQLDQDPRLTDGEQVMLRAYIQVEGRHVCVTAGEMNRGLRSETSATLEGCSRLPTQLWRYRPSRWNIPTMQYPKFHLQSLKNPQLCLDGSKMTEHGSTIVVQVYNCNETSAQTWYIR